MTAPLAALDAASLERRLGEADVADLATDLTACSDAELDALLARTDLDQPVVLGLLDRFAEFADPERLALIDGVVRFELDRGRGRGHGTVVRTLRLQGGVVERADDADPDVEIRMRATDLVGLLTGQANAALLYLAADLSLRGDAALALDVGSVFTVPGTDRAAVDPSALDPVDVATACAGASTEHLRAVMAGGYREVVLGEVFRRFPEFVDAERARRTDVAVGFKIGGRPDGEHDRFLVRIERGTCTVLRDPGVHGEATLVVDGAAFLRLVTGQLHPVRGVLTGAIKVSGDRAKALGFNALIHPPEPRPG